MSDEDMIAYNKDEYCLPDIPLKIVDYSYLLTPPKPGLFLLYTHGTFKDTLDTPYHPRAPDLIKRHSHDVRLVTCGARISKVSTEASQFSPKVTSLSPFSPQHILKCLGFPVNRLLLPPSVLILCMDLRTHESGLVGISPITTTTRTFD
ncbi:hypothetical protein TNCV_2295041 [Trichonephila clavipes]|nr:hypothetical protein TNCV_2295041 [Trichonephila clavipes]